MTVLALIFNSDLIIDLSHVFMALAAMIITILSTKWKFEADRSIVNMIKKNKDELLFNMQKVGFIEDLTIDYLSQLRANVEKQKRSGEIFSIETFYKEYERSKYLFIKDQIKILANQLNEKSKNEVLNALDQNSLPGQFNYINNLLTKSGIGNLLKLEYQIAA